MEIKITHNMCNYTWNSNIFQRDNFPLNGSNSYIYVGSDSKVWASDVRTVNGVPTGLLWCLFCFLTRIGTNFSLFLRLFSPLQVSETAARNLVFNTRKTKDSRNWLQPPVSNIKCVKMTTLYRSVKDSDF